MDLSQVERLKEQHKTELQICEDKIAKWEKFKTDYEILKQQLETLPHELSYDITVPFGPNAFTMGQLVRTNEIMVLLGDNWFAEVSAKQAAAIADRRIAQCVNMLKDLDVEKQQFINWLSYIEEVSGGSLAEIVEQSDEENEERGKKARIAWHSKKDMDETSGEELIEIFEEYDEEKEKAWREQHAKNVKAYRQKIAKKRKYSYSSEDTVSNSEDECLAKLEKLEIGETAELELLESVETAEELELLESVETVKPDSEQIETALSQEIISKSDDQIFSKVKKPGLKLNINCSNKDSSVAETESGEDDGSKSDDVNSNLENCNAEAHAKHVRWQDQSKQKVKKITFKHSKSKHHTSSKHQFKKQDSSESEPLIRSPSDIYKHFGSLFMATSPKSILKVKNSSSSPEGSDSFFAVNEKVPHVTSPLIESENIAFTGQVIENSSPIHISEKKSSSSKNISHFKNSRKSKKRLSH